MSIENASEFLIYQTDDGQTKIDVRMENETVWLSQSQMAELFQTTPQNITLHIKNVYSEGELPEDSTCKEYLQVQKEGNRSVKRNTKFYNLDVIISVRYRVKSHRGTLFRIWATQRLREYIIKGFTMIAMMKANEEFGKFTERTKNELSQVEKHFIGSIDSTAKKLKESKRQH